MTSKSASNRYSNTKYSKSGFPTPNIGYRWAKAFNKRTLKDHFKRHKDDFGVSTAKEYEAHAVRFANTINREKYVSKVLKNGLTAKYDLETGRFAKITKQGYVITYFKPKDGYEYYLRDIRGEND